MAVVGGVTITDDALFGIPDPDYSDAEEDGGSSNKKPLAATLSSESIGHNSTSCARVESTHSNDKSTDKATDEELEASKPDYADNEDGIKTSADVTTNDVKSGIDNKTASTSSSENRLSPDAALEGLSLNHEVGSNRGSFRSSGSRSPINLIVGVSHEHVAADPVLIEPKKVPNVPQLTKEQKEVQRELQFKQKQGNMLEKKPELKKVMDDRKHKMKKEELKKEQESTQSTFSIKMGKQAKKLLEMEEQEENKKLQKSNSSNEPQLDEFKKVHSKIHRNKITT